MVRTVEVVSRRVHERAAAQQAAHLVGQLSNLLLLQTACMHSIQVMRGHVWDGLLQLRYGLDMHTMEQPVPTAPMICYK